LRDLPVLAEATLKIATDRSNGEGTRPWEKVVEGFFLDGVDVLGNEVSISMSKENTTSILPDIADAKFSVGDPAMVAAQKAGNRIASHFFIKHRFLEHCLSPLCRIQ
jgi:hypothetical protein